MVSYPFSVFPLQFPLKLITRPSILGKDLKKLFKGYVLTWFLHSATSKAVTLVNAVLFKFRETILLYGLLVEDSTLAASSFIKH